MIHVFWTSSGQWTEGFSAKVPTVMDGRYAVGKCKWPLRMVSFVETLMQA